MGSMGRTRTRLSSRGVFATRAPGRLDGAGAFGRITLSGRARPRIYVQCIVWRRFTQGKGMCPRWTGRNHLRSLEQNSLAR